MNKLAYVESNNINDIMFDTTKSVYAYEQYEISISAKTSATSLTGDSVVLKRLHI